MISSAGSARKVAGSVLYAVHSAALTRRRLSPMVRFISALLSSLRWPSPLLWPNSWAHSSPSWLAVKRTTARELPGVGEQAITLGIREPHQLMAVTTLTQPATAITVLNSA